MAHVVGAHIAVAALAVFLHREPCCRRGQAPNKTALVQICYFSSPAPQQQQQPAGAAGSEPPALDVPALVASGGACCTCLLLHVWHSGISDSLRRLLADERITKVGVHIGGDAAKLELDYQLQVGGGAERGCWSW
jgi:hypothetical protein